MPDQAPIQTSPTPPRRSKRSRIAAKLALLTVGLVVAALLVEATVLIVAGEQPKFPRHVVGAPWGLRYNEPGASYRHKSADVNIRFDINNQGMRDTRDFAYAKPEGVKRIVSVGDSFTIGYEVDADNTFNAVLERELSAAGIKAQVLNCGVSGYSNAEECLYVERELFKYDPDAVMVSFFPNDLVDNIRSGLFRLEDGQLKGGDGNYVPGGKFGDFVNTNWLLGFLSGYSNAFVLVKERLSIMAKAKIVEQNKQNVVGATAPAASSEPGSPNAELLQQQRLCAAIFERLYKACREKNVTLIIHSIPWRADDGTERLVDLFPVDLFDTTREGIVFVPAKPELDLFVGKELLYYTRSHWHWTPFCHDHAGKLLARAIIDRAVLH